MDVAGKVALLTGGARIGQTVAQAIAQRGCGLALTYRRSRDAAEATAPAARATGVRTVVLRADVIDEAQVAAAVRQAEQVLGRLDILVNLASTYERTPLESAGARTFSDALDANAGAPGCSQSMPRLRCGGPAAAASST
jgi:NAD(P)-dependent dehydrogenase (short-subunit alcohol dehydrogenase family)